MCCRPRNSNISRLAERGLKRQGMDIHTSTPVEGVSSEEGGVRLSYGWDAAEVDYLVIAAGRGPDVDALGLKDAGVELDEKGLHPWSAAHRGWRPTRSAISCTAPRSPTRPRTGRGRRGRRRPGHAPTLLCGHSARHLARPVSELVGLTKPQAKEQGYDVVVGKVPYGAVGGGTVYGDRTGLVELVGETKYGELLGGHIVS